MSEIMLSVPDEALSAMKMTPEQFGGNFAWPEPSSSTRWDGCHQGQRRKSQAFPELSSSRSWPTLGSTLFG